jgi:predicted N-acetyltransferase YhbS
MRIAALTTVADDSRTRLNNGLTQQRGQSPRARTNGLSVISALPFPFIVVSSRTPGTGLGLGLGSSVAVEPDYRDRGIAGCLVETLLMRARGTEARDAYLFSTVAPAYFARWGLGLPRFIGQIRIGILCRWVSSL